MLLLLVTTSQTVERYRAAADRQLWVRAAGVFWGIAALFAFLSTLPLLLKVKPALLARNNSSSAAASAARAEQSSS